MVGHFTVHGLSVSVSVNTGATPGVAADIHTNSAVIDAVTGFIAATMAADAAAVHDATLTFVNAFMNVDPATAAAMHFLSAISVMPEHAPAPALPIGAPIPVLGATAPPTTLSAWEMEGVGGEIEGVGGEEEEEAAEEEQMVVQEEQIAVQEVSEPEVSQVMHGSDTCRLCHVPCHLCHVPCHLSGGGASRGARGVRQPSAAGRRLLRTHVKQIRPKNPGKQKYFHGCERNRLQ